MRDIMLLDDPSNCPSTSNPSSILPEAVSINSSYKKSRGNVYNLLSRREVAPRTKRLTRRLWEEGVEDSKDSRGQILVAGTDARRGLISWVEAESLRHFSAQYCPLLPPPRSTIAAAFSSDGKILASTHGDHTVKIIDCQTGNCLKVLSGHRRTPWVVRFHPTCPVLLASGSLDHDVRLWDANTAECIGSRDFYRPIASIAFHSQGELLAVASGHKLYIWHYNKRGDASTPTIVLKTRRSLRAVHFHPHAPFLLTAEVNDLDSADSSMTLATCRGYVRYPLPTVYFTDTHYWDRPSLLEELPHTSLPYLVWPQSSLNNERISLQYPDGAGLATTQQRVGPASVRLLTYSTPSGQYELLLSPIEPTDPSPALDETDPTASDMVTDATDPSDSQPEEINTQVSPFRDPSYWELPFLQGWLIGQSQGDQRVMRPSNGILQELPPPMHGDPSNPSSNHEPVSLGVYTRGTGASRLRSSHTRTTGNAAGTEGPQLLTGEGDAQPVIGRIQTELSASLAAAAAAELPCTVKLRIWPHDIKNPSAPLEGHKCRLTIPHAVLCSEMGAHFSPCGRFLAACVACMLPPAEGELNSQTQHDVSRSASSPTRHPIAVQPVIYELRIYSLEEATFGLVLASRAVRAAHCLTSIQFSPTSEHLLLAYGRRHNSLLKSVVIDGDSTVHIYTILEVYRVSDMELVRVVPSADDEVNVACFHPNVGGGLVYGTKEGKLRILQHNRSSSMTSTTSSFLDENLIEVPPHALEG